MRNDAFHLREILDAAEPLESLRAATDSEERLLQDRAFRHSVLFEFIAIGEHAGALSPELKDRRGEGPWARIVAFRHRLAHGCFELSLAIVSRFGPSKYQN